MKTVHTTVTHIFAMYPELCGFSVQDASIIKRERVSGQLEAGLYLADVATTTNGSSEQLLGEISVALLELIDEDPEAIDALRGRTFARTLH